MIVRIKDKFRLTPNQTAGVINYDVDNLYPQRIASLIDNSKTARAAARYMSDNIECNGFADKELGVRQNGNGRTMDDVLRAVSYDFARFEGFYLICQYNALGKVVNVYNIPFEYVRAVLNDDYKNDSKITKYKVFNNWDKSSVLSTDPNTGTVYNVFNPSTVLQEIDEAGGIENYAGQIFACKSAIYQCYPQSTFHAVQNEMYTEYAKSLMAQRTLSLGYFSNKVIEYGPFATDEENEMFMQDIAEMMGADNSASNIIIPNNDMSTNKVRVTELGTPLKADEYNALSEPIKKDICMSAHALPLGLIDTSEIGITNISGNTIREMKLLYRDGLASVRALIVRSFATIFDTNESVFQINDKFDNYVTNEGATNK